MSPPKNHSEPNTYVLIAQANCKKMPQGMVELTQYINSAMRKYRVEPDSLELPFRHKKRKDGAAQQSDGPSKRKMLVLAGCENLYVFFFIGQVVMGNHTLADHI